METVKPVSKASFLLFCSLATMLSAAVQAADPYQYQVLFTPSENILRAETRGRIMIYDGLDNADVERPVRAIRSHRKHDVRAHASACPGRRLCRRGRWLRLIDCRPRNRPGREAGRLRPGPIFISSCGYCLARPDTSSDRGETMRVQARVMRHDDIVNVLHPVRRLRDVDVIARLRLEAVGSAQIGGPGTAAVPADLAARAGRPRQRSLEISNTDRVAECFYDAVPTACGKSNPLARHCPSCLAGSR